MQNQSQAKAQGPAQARIADSVRQAHLASAAAVELSSELKAAVDRACASIAPTWPLDRFIAVNPLWSRTSEPLPQVASRMASLSGATLLMPRSWYAREWREGRLRAEHLRAAIRRTGSRVSEERLMEILGRREERVLSRPRVVDVLDQEPRRKLEMPWREFVIHRTSQFCASYFDDGQASFVPDKNGGLYASWRRFAPEDRGPSTLMGLAGGHAAFRALAESLPDNAEAMIGLAMADLGVPSHEHENYLQMLLLDINGWASWCAYLRWTARLAGGDDRRIIDLLAVRIAWEWILLRAGGDRLEADWHREMAAWPAVDRQAESARKDDWLLQEAAEIAWQDEISRRLPEGFAQTRPSAPKAQAIFCIDVRSEVYRRALEAQDQRIQTLGFAGFFGMPIEYAPVGAQAARPQLPGLLAPKFRVVDQGVDEKLPALRRSRLHVKSAWKSFKGSPLSSFAFVESMGLFFGGGLLAETFFKSERPGESHERAGLTAAEDRVRSPKIALRADGSPMSGKERCDLAEGMLRAMSLTRGLAPLVLLIGHGSETRNNPHAAGLDCGACCGQTGEANARAAAELLNDPEVREALRARGLEVPSGTRFVGALHNTTTDEIAIFDEAAIPEEHRPALAELRADLRAASAVARRERAPKLGLGDLPGEKLEKAIEARARDWSEVRPEWGLAGNAAFIVAPRERSKHLRLDGRSFLHDYRWQEDKDFAILELIMTAPMVVTHWINFQYYASTVDNLRYGCGNKVLHNVVGGHVGVFEGNGGDLRIGLSMQSLHDGDRWQHAPLRLAVYLEAPREAIDRVLQKHAKVRELVENEWIRLFQIDSDAKGVFARRGSEWRNALS